MMVTSSFEDQLYINKTLTCIIYYQFHTYHVPSFPGIIINQRCRRKVGASLFINKPSKIALILYYRALFDDTNRKCCLQLNRPVCSLKMKTHCTIDLYLLDGPMDRLSIQLAFMYLRSDYETRQWSKFDSYQDHETCSGRNMGKPSGSPFRKLNDS